MSFACGAFFDGTDCSVIASVIAEAIDLITGSWGHFSVFFRDCRLLTPK
jgi:hypothetical protein